MDLKSIAVGALSTASKVMVRLIQPYFTELAPWQGEKWLSRPQRGLVQPSSRKAFFAKQ